MKKIEMIVEFDTMNEEEIEEAEIKVMEKIWCRGSKEAMYTESLKLKNAPFFGKPEIKKVMNVSWYGEFDDDLIYSDLNIIKGISYKIYSTEIKEEKYKSPRPVYESKMLW